MQGSNKKFVQKVEEAAELASHSAAMKKAIELSKAQWIGILSDLDEKKVDELIFVLHEEQKGDEAIENKRQRRQQINNTQRLQRLERLRIRLEEINERLK